MQPRWYYDEFRQVGVDFEAIAEVAEYERKQGASPDAERALIARLGIGTGSVVVDLGCGTGSFAREAARHDATVHAVDVADAMLAFAEQKARAQGIDGIRFHRAGFLTFAASPGSVDVVVTRFALHHLPDFWKQVALLRIAEMLRDGGTLFLRDVIFSFEPDAYRTSLEAWIARMPAIAGFSAEEFATHAREEYSTFAWVLEGMLGRAGFEIGEKRYTAPEYAEYVCRRRARS